MSTVQKISTYGLLVYYIQYYIYTVFVGKFNKKKKCLPRVIENVKNTFECLSKSITVLKKKCISRKKKNYCSAGEIRVYIRVNRIRITRTINT